MIRYLPDCFIDEVDGQESIEAVVGESSAQIDEIGYIEDGESSED